MESKQKRRLTYSIIAIVGAVILVLAVILMQQPIQKTAVPQAKTPPGVSTAAATGVGQTVATMNGNLASLGTASTATVGFLYGTSSSLAGATNVTIGTETAAASLEQNLTGLASGTAYYFEAWGLGDGFSAGSALHFTTLTQTAPQIRAPSVTTNAASSIGVSSATLNGNLASLGTSPTVTIGFVYSTSSSLAGATNLSMGTKSASAAFSDAVSGLASNTTYYVRAWALGHGFASGSVVSFTTTSTPSGNGNIVPPGWAHAACPNLPEQAAAHGVRARCEHNMTWGEMKKLGLAGIVTTPGGSTSSHGNAASAAVRTSDPGNSGEHRSDKARHW